jgi:hypothetical protein
VSKISTVRKDGRSQRMSLANNLRANAANLGLAVHGGTMVEEADGVKVLTASPSQADAARPELRHLTKA